MSLLNALAISIGVLGAIATFLFVGPLGGLGLQIWAAFIAWACFFHAGGKEAGLQTTVASNVLGAIIFAISFMILNALAGSMGVPLAAAIAVGLGIVGMVLAANIPMFASIPATVYGYAATAGLTLLSGAVTDKTAVLGSLGSTAIGGTPLFNIIASMIIGAGFGYLSEKLAGSLAKS